MKFQDTIGKAVASSREMNVFKISQKSGNLDGKEFNFRNEIYLSNFKDNFLLYL